MSNGQNLGQPAISVLENTHKLLLEALRHREQEIFSYLAIIGPAIGGFFWLLQHRNSDPGLFTLGTMGVLLLLFFGAVYTLALGYNYRYITFQLAKLEVRLGIKGFMLKGWPRSKQEWRPQRESRPVPAPSTGHRS